MASWTSITMKVLVVYEVAIIRPISGPTLRYYYYDSRFLSLTAHFHLVRLHSDIHPSHASCPAACALPLPDLTSLSTYSSKVPYLRYLAGFSALCLQRLPSLPQLTPSLSPPVTQTAWNNTSACGDCPPHQTQAARASRTPEKACLTTLQKIL